MAITDENKVLAALWENFERSVVAATAGATQRLEMHRAFYAGAAALMKVLRVIDDSVSDDAGVEMLESVNRELAQFAVDVREGRR